MMTARDRDRRLDLHLSCSAALHPSEQPRIRLSEPSSGADRSCSCCARHQINATVRPHPGMTTPTDDSQSPATKAFATRLSRFAYRPQPSPASPGPSRSNPRQSVDLKPATRSPIRPSVRRRLDPEISPVQADDDTSGGARKRRRLKIEADDEDRSGSGGSDDEYRDPSTPSKGRGSVKTNKTSSTTKRSTSIPKTDGAANDAKDKMSIECTAKSPGKKPRPFAGPEVYAHLKPVSDHLGPGLRSGSLPLASKSFPV